MDELLEVVIDRKKWGTGSSGGGYLLNKDTNKMCCLGFVCRKVGISTKKIEGLSMPSEVLIVGRSCTKHVDPRIPTSLSSPAGHNKRYADVLARTNDRIDLSNSRREKLIIKYGLKAGIKFSFIN